MVLSLSPYCFSAKIVKRVYTYNKYPSSLLSFEIALALSSERCIHFPWKMWIQHEANFESSTCPTERWNDDGKGDVVQTLQKQGNPAMLAICFKALNINIMALWKDNSTNNGSDVICVCTDKASIKTETASAPHSPSIKEIAVITAIFFITKWNISMCYITPYEKQSRPWQSIKYPFREELTGLAGTSNLMSFLYVGVATQRQDG